MATDMLPKRVATTDLALFTFYDTHVMLCRHMLVRFPAVKTRPDGFFSGRRLGRVRNELRVLSCFRWWEREGRGEQPALPQGPDE